MAQAPMPSLPIDRGRPGPGLLAHVLVSKYCDHLPLYRQAQIYAREGVDLDRATMAAYSDEFERRFQSIVNAGSDDFERAGVRRWWWFSLALLSKAMRRDRFPLNQ